MQTGKWLSLEEEECTSTSSGRKSLYDKDVMDFRFSSSGRYGFLVRERAVEPSRGQSTHFYELFFSVVDTFRGTLTHYKPMTSVFRTYHRFYVLGDDLCVLMDFSRHNSIVSQNLLFFDHARAEVRSEYARHWRFAVDEMLAGTDGTYVPGTSQLLQIDDERYVPLLGQLDRLSGQIVMRVVPADPRRLSAAAQRAATRLFLINPSSLTCAPNTRIKTPAGELVANDRRCKAKATNSSGAAGSSGASEPDDEDTHAGRRLAGCTTDYPFIFKSRIFFFVSRAVNAPAFASNVNVEPPLSFCIKWMLEIDVAALLRTPQGGNSAGLSSPSHSSAPVVLPGIRIERRRRLMVRGFAIFRMVDGDNVINGTAHVEADLAQFGVVDTEEVEEEEDGVDAPTPYELIRSEDSCVNLRRIDVTKSELVADRDVIEMYTYIQAGAQIYVRVQFRSMAHNNYHSIHSKWICLNLRTWRWNSFFKQPCRARIPFWFCGVPDGRAFFYRQVWQRGTKRVIARQLRIMMPPRDVLSLRQLAFFVYGASIHAPVTVTLGCEDELAGASAFSKKLAIANCTGDSATNTASHRNCAAGNFLAEDDNVRIASKDADHRPATVADTYVAQLQRLFRLFESF